MNDYLDHNKKAEEKRFNDMIKFSKKCKCGHTVIVASVDRVLCTWCGHWVYKDDKTEFMYKMKERMKQK